VGGIQGIVRRGAPRQLHGPEKVLLNDLRRRYLLKVPDVKPAAPPADKPADPRRETAPLPFRSQTARPVSNAAAASSETTGRKLNGYNDYMVLSNRLNCFFHLEPFLTITHTAIYHNNNQPLNNHNY
jgi:hypothetical protein